MHVKRRLWLAEYWNKNQQQQLEKRRRESGGTDLKFYFLSSKGKAIKNDVFRKSGDKCVFVKNWLSLRLFDLSNSDDGAMEKKFDG